MITDPIADMLTRIRNANAVGHTNVEMPASKLKLEVAKILQAEGFVRGFQVVEKGATLRIRLKYGTHRETAITNLQRVSRPGRRVYCTRDTLPRVLGGLGIAVVSTNKGVMTAEQARRLGVGGEVLAKVW